MSGAWAASWGLSWGGSWGAGAEPVVGFVSTSAGTQYRHVTLSRESRERERKARKAARNVRQRVIARVAPAANAKAEVSAFVKAEIEQTWLPQLAADPLGQQLFDAAVRALIAQARQFQIDRMREDEDDDILLLFAA